MKELVHVNEDGSINVETKAEYYFNRYRDHMQVLESKSPLSKLRSINSWDYYSLGKQCEAFEVYKKICEADGTVAQLGRVPDVAFDVLTVNYGSSPIAAIASIQPIDEELGTVYFKNVFAQSTRGNVTANQMLVGATQAEEVGPIGFAGDTLTQAVGNTVDMQTVYNTNAGFGPIKPSTVYVTCPELGLTARDDMKGHLVGYNLQGTVDYAHGAVSIQFINNPGNNHPIILQYATDFELSGDIPQIQFRLDTKSVRARVFALKDTVGLEQSYALRRRFGIIADDEIANDLVSAINSEIVNTLVTMINAHAMGQHTWRKVPDQGTSYFEHKQTFKDAISEAETIILANAGRGTINTMIVGRSAAAIISTLPGFVKISDGTTLGPHIYGTLDGISLVRIPNTNILDPNTILCLYNSGTPFEAPAVYAPYMPLLVTTAIPNGNNPLMNLRAAAVWAALDILVPRFITKIVVDPSVIIDPARTSW